MNFFSEKLTALKEWYEDKKREWLEEGKLQEEASYLTSYILGIACGWLYKKSEEWQSGNGWYKRAFNKYYDSEPLRITHNPSKQKLGPPRTTIVVSAPYCDYGNRHWFGSKKKM